MNKKRKGGFTLVELLATLAVLSLVLSIVIYASTGIINNAKAKSYETTMNNILVAGGNYTIENPELSEWIPCKSGNCEYQCVSINELISNGYFKGDILESKVEKDISVEESDFVYIERDITNKTITRKIFENKYTADKKCTLSAYGAIEFKVTPSTWAKEKTVTITYTLNSNQDIDTKAEYEFIGVNGQIKVNKNISFDSTRVESVTVEGITENGVLTAKIGESDIKTLYISTIDRFSPTIDKFESNHNLSNNQTVTITLNDSASGNDSTSGIKGYYFGKIDPSKNDVTYEKVANVKSLTLTKEVDSTEKWYLRTVDLAGNYSDVKSLEFFETKLNIDGHATVIPARILDVSGSTYTLPKVGSGVTVDNYYTFKGWYDNGSAKSTYKVTSTNKTLEGRVTENLFEGNVTINGTAKSGSTLTADTSKVTLTNHSNNSNVTYTYQWYYNGSNSNSGGTKISGATKKTYTLTDSVVGKYIYVVVTAKRTNYQSTTYTSNVSSKIQAKTTSVTPPTTKQPNPIIVSANTLTYNVNYQNLITTSKAQGTVYYSTKTVLTSSNCNSSVGAKNTPMERNAGTYTVYWCVTGNEDYAEDSGSVIVTIKKATNPIKVTANDLTYTGDWQKLVTTSGAQGTVYYSKTTSVTSSNFMYAGNPSIPSGIDVQKYTVYWYVNGNNNYEEKYGNVKVTIGKAIGYVNFNQITKQNDKTVKLWWKDPGLGISNSNYKVDLLDLLYLEIVHHGGTLSANTDGSTFEPTVKISDNKIVQITNLANVGKYDIYNYKITVTSAETTTHTSASATFVISALGFNTKKSGYYYTCPGFMLEESLLDDWYSEMSDYNCSVLKQSFLPACTYVLNNGGSYANKNYVLNSYMACTKY